MHRSAASTAMALELLLAPLAGADIILLDIDPHPAMSNLPGAAVPAAAKLSNEFLAQGVLVSSISPYAAVAKGSGVHWFPDPVLLNGVGGVNAAGQLSYGSPVIFEIVEPCNPAQPRTTTWFSVHTDYQGIGGVCSLTAYDADEVVVDSEVKAEHFGTALEGTQYAVSGAGIVKVVFQGAGTQAISNIRLENPLPAAGCAPDFNVDGEVDGDDLGTLLGLWGRAGECVHADFNRDGQVDGDDLGTLLGAWGPCR